MLHDNKRRFIHGDSASQRRRGRARATARRRWCSGATGRRRDAPPCTSTPETHAALKAYAKANGMHLAERAAVTSVFLSQEPRWGLPTTRVAGHRLLEGGPPVAHRQGAVMIDAELAVAFTASHAEPHVKDMLAGMPQ